MTSDHVLTAESQCKITGDSNRKKSFKIMIVDDEESIRDLLQFMLAEDGHDTALAEDSEKALGSFRSYQPDLIISDMRMPKMSGVELASG